MKSSFLEFLCCPLCHADLRLTVQSQEGEEMMSGALDCTQCEKSYPLRDGIPRFQLAPLEGDQARTVAAFGAQWRSFSWLDPAYEKQFLDWIRPVTTDFFSGKTVLDAGCGKGRHLVQSQKFGAKTVVGFDLSDAVEVAFAHTRDMPNVHVAQADIFQLPLKPTFDYAYSLGVLHHTPDPEAAFLRLTTTLLPGGAISTWVYGRENNGWIIGLVNPFRRAITSRLGTFGQRVVSFGISAGLLWPILQIFYKRKIGKQLFYGEYLSYIAPFSFRDVRAIVYDHLTPPTAFYIRRENFAGWFQKSGLIDVEIAHHNRNSWRGFARRPKS